MLSFSIGVYILAVLSDADRDFYMRIKERQVEMCLDKLSEFFMWSCAINIGIFMLSFVLLTCLKDFVYKVHSRMFPMPRETFNVVIYSFFGVYKIIFIVFNLVPFIVIQIIK